MKILKITLAGLVLTLLLYSCNNKKATDDSQFPKLNYDTLYTFSIGDTFTIQTYQNSCCTNCWVNIDQYADTFVHKGLIEKIKVKEIPSDGADGSSSFVNIYYKCIKSGIDTLYYAVIPNGDLDSDYFDCSAINIYKDSISGKINVPKEYLRRYIFKVNSDLR